MKNSLILGVLAIAASAIAGCDDDITTLVRTAAPTATPTRDDTGSPVPFASETPLLFASETPLPLASETPLPLASETAAAIATATPTPTLEPLATASIAPPPPTATPLPTSPPQTPTPAGTQVAPEITYLGVAAADDVVVGAIDIDEEGRDVYARLLGHGFSLVIEAAAMAGGRPVGASAFSADGLPPDLQILVSRDLGDGAPEVCDVDIDNQIFGGVPGFDPPSFTSEPEVVDALNDLGCRVNDGTGAPLGRPVAFPCTRDGFGNFGLVDPRSAIQFCLPIARAWTFQDGDTIVAARVRSTSGALSPVSEIVISVDRSDLEDVVEGNRLDDF